MPIEVEGLLDAKDLVYTLVYADLARIHAPRLASEPERFHPDTLVRVGLGVDITVDERAAAVAARRALQSRISAAMDGVDLFLTPTLPVDVPRADPDDVLRVSRRLGQLTYPWSLHAGPTLAPPIGFHPDSGMPVGVQLTAPEAGEDVLFMAGLWFQERTDHHNHCLRSTRATAQRACADPARPLTYHSAPPAWPASNECALVLTFPLRAAPPRREELATPRARQQATYSGR